MKKRMGKGVQKMKKESNGSLFFLLAVGIVGLGLYFGASENYSEGELQLYHMICWVVLLIALLRILELIWEPVRSLWDQAWGKAQEKTGEKERVNRASQQEENRRVPFAPEEEESRHSDYARYSVYPEQASDKEEEKIHRADGVIIMPDRGSRFYLDDRYREPERKYDRADLSEEPFRPVSESVESGSETPVNQPSDQPEKKKDKDKKKKKKK